MQDNEFSTFLADKMLDHLILDTSTPSHKFCIPHWQNKMSSKCLHLIPLSETGKPKLEYRNSKQTQITEMLMTKTDIHYCFDSILFLMLDIRISILFRISDFDIRIFTSDVK